jgi:hypothetical protein
VVDESQLERKSWIGVGELGLVLGSRWIPYDADLVRAKERRSGSDEIKFHQGYEGKTKQAGEQRREARVEPSRVESSGLRRIEWRCEERKGGSDVPKGKVWATLQ